MHHLSINTWKEQDTPTMAVRGKRTYPHEGPPDYAFIPSTSNSEASWKRNIA
jgi:hypothetical protein